MKRSLTDPIHIGPIVDVAGHQTRPGSCDAEAAEAAIPPYGGTLRNLVVNAAMAEELKLQSRDWPSWDLTPRQLSDLELLLNGGFSPLRGFLDEADYDRVCREMRLADGTLWPVPVVLDVPEAFTSRIGAGSKVALRDPEGVMLAALTVQDLWRPDRATEAELVYETTDTHHAGVRFLLDQVGPVYLGGKIEGLQLPHHHDFQYLRHTPLQLREKFRRLGCKRVIAFQTRNPMHQAHFWMTRRAAEECGANLLIHPVTGMAKPGDVDHFCRVRCYQALLPRYPENLAELSLLPLSMRMAGPREAVWHAIIRRNYGCSHLIVGRDHAGPGNDRGGRPFYTPYAAQELLRKHESELGISPVPFPRMVYCPVRNEHLPATQLPSDAKTLDLSGTELTDRLADGREIPEWFTFPEVAAELRKAYPPRSQQGFTIFFTGLSGSGKSTLARALFDKLFEIGGRPVTLLDGDIIGRNLSSELGFSREDRNLNILRIGFVANEITRNRGVAICAPIAPYEDIRQQVRQLISGRGGFILIYLSTPLEICEQRDRKGLYAKARAGIVKEFTGISDPYEAPADAQLVLNTAEMSVEEACQAIINHLHEAGYLAPGSTRGPEAVSHQETCTRTAGACPADSFIKRFGVAWEGPALISRRPRSFGDMASRGLWHLDFEELCALAMRSTGLEDFGSPPLTPALPILLDSLEQEANLHPLGRLLMRIHLRDLLTTRLRLADTWKGGLERMEREPLKRPIFIVGMPRSGSTFLHELLAADPDNRAPRVWEVMYPLAAGSEHTGGREAYIRKAEVCLWWFRRLAPRADSVYPMRSMTPHECVAIQSHTFLSEEFVSSCRIPSYEAFLRAADLKPAYVWQKRFLQHLQLGAPEKRWVLKSPDHVHGLEALFSVFPDAILIQTHRNPMEVLKSSADLTQVLRRLYARAGDPAETFASETRMLAANTERFIHFRDRHPELADRIIDIKYTDLVTDPLGAVQTIYARIGIALNESHAGRVRQLASDRSRYQGERASAKPFRVRLQAGHEIVRFERYCLRFGLPFQGTE